MNAAANDEAYVLLDKQSPQGTSCTSSCVTLDTPTTDSPLTRDRIEMLGTKIMLADRDDDANLDMFCYIKCDEKENETIKQCRGVVFNGKTLVMRGFPYTIDCDTTRKDVFDEYDFSTFRFFEAHEGTLIRMFYFDDKWYVTTHRKLNAYRSKWASRESFGQYFQNAIEWNAENNAALKAALPDATDENDTLMDRFKRTLDTSKQYMFLLRNSSTNRIVCRPPPHPTVYHVGTFVDDTLTLDDDIHIPHPKELTFDTAADLFEAADEMPYQEYQGVIAFSKDNVQIKVVSVDYQYLFNVRGNEPSIRYRYLQVRHDHEMHEALSFLYPEMVQSFEEYERYLGDITRFIYRSYVNRFIKKQFVTVPQEEYAVMRECHQWHLSDKRNNHISIDMVGRILNRQTPTQLNRMIRRLRLERNAASAPNRGNAQSPLQGTSLHVMSTSPLVISTAKPPNDIPPTTI